MNINVNDLMLTSVETITAFDIVTGNYKFTLDELQNVTVAQGQEKTDLTGKQGRKLGSLKRNKTVTISGTNGLVSAGLLEAQTGSAFEQKATTVLWTDYVKVSGNKAATTYVAVGTTGNEIDSVYVKNTNNTLGTVLTQGATASEGVFAYDPATKELSFADLADGTELVVFYSRKINGSVQSNMSDSYSEKLTLFIDAFAEDTCANVYRVQIHIPKADFDGNFELAMGDSQTVHSFEAESLAGACGSNGALWNYTVFGADEEDVA